MRRGFRCPCYTAPLDSSGAGGQRTGITFEAGDVIDIEGDLYQTAEYVAVKTSRGWINVWCLRNNRGEMRGIFFVDIHWERL